MDTRANEPTDGIGKGREWGGILCRHAAAISAMSLSLDDRWLVTAAEDDSLWLCEPLRANRPEDHRVLLDPGEDSGHRFVIFSADARWIAATTSPGRLWLCDLQVADAIAQSVAATEGEFAILDIATSDDARWLATAHARGIIVLCDLRSTDPAGGATVLPSDAGRVNRVAISPDSRWLASASEVAVYLYDLASADVHASRTMLGAIEQGSSLAFSPDGRWLAAAGLTDDVILWHVQEDASDWNAVQLVGHGHYVVTLAFSPDSSRLATGSLDNTARLWDLTSAAAMRSPNVFRRHTDCVRRLAISPDGRWLVTAAWDSRVLLWRLDSVNPESWAFPLECADCGAGHLAISRDSHWLLAASGSLSFCEEGKNAFVWDLSAPDPSVGRLTLAGHELDVTCAAFTHDARTVITGSRDGTARVWTLGPP